jgi:hypothetical protein
VDIREENIRDVTVAITRGPDLEIQLNLQNSGLTDAQAFSFTLRPRDSVATFLTQHVTAPLRFSADGDLKVQSVPQGAYVLAPDSVPPGFYVADIRQGGRIIYDDGVIQIDRDSAEPVRIEIARGGGRIEGTVEEGQSIAKEPIRVTLVPVAARRGNPIFYKQTLASNGTFVITDIPPGRYKIFAWQNLPAGAEENEQFLSRYEDQGQVISVSGASVATLRTRLITHQ